MSIEWNPGHGIVTKTVFARGYWGSRDGGLGRLGVGGLWGDVGGGGGGQGVMGLFGGRGGHGCLEGRGNSD